MSIVITEFMDEAAVDELRARFPTHYDPSLVDNPERLWTLLPKARALIVRNRTHVDAELLSAAERLEVVGRLGVGLDNIDVEACKARGIAVHPATGANARAVAEYVLTMTLTTLRGAYSRSYDVAVGRWPRPELVDGREAYGKLLGLVGFGDIGRLTARLAQAIGIEVVAHDPLLPDDSPVWQEHGVAPLPLVELLERADVVSLHLPLNEQTRGLFDRDRLFSMKPGAILINTARGAIVDEKALAAALYYRHLGGAAIDVFEQEPLPPTSPLVGLPNLWLTPHIAGLSAESNLRVSALIAQKVADTLAAAAGRPQTGESAS